MVILCLSIEDFAGIATRGLSALRIEDVFDDMGADMVDRMRGRAVNRPAEVRALAGERQGGARVPIASIARGIELECLLGGAVGLAQHDINRAGDGIGCTRDGVGRIRCVRSSPER